MAMNHPEPLHSSEQDGPEYLACGRDLASLWEDTDGAADDPHTHRCPYCRQALADLERLRAAALAPAAAESTSAQETAALVRRVMDVVRLELRPGRTLPLGAEDAGTWIYESVAARTLRTAAEEVAGVRAGSCRITPPGGAAPQRGTVTVHLKITVEYGRDLRTTSDTVRLHTVGAAFDRLGLTVCALDVTVTDLHDPPDLPQKATT